MTFHYRIIFHPSLQIDRISAIAAKYVGKPAVNYPLLSSPLPPRSLELGVGNFGALTEIGGEMYGVGDLLRSIGAHSDIDKPMIVELAVAAMEELFRMAQMGDPLWMSSLDGTDDVLNEDEYIRIFPRGIGPRPIGFKCEASRETAIVMMDYRNLVECLMDVVVFLSSPKMFLILGQDPVVVTLFFFFWFSESVVYCVFRHRFKSYDCGSSINRSSRKL